METVLLSNMALSPEIQKALEDMQYKVATEIQTRAIPLIMQGADIIGKSGTGTGKTAAFGIPAAESIQKGDREPKVLILCPTRELAMQIDGEVRKYAKYKPEVSVAAVYGGAAMGPQIGQLRTANIVIGTPGRLMDHLRRRTLSLKSLRMVVLDEADEMLDMGFYEDIETILTDVPEERQTLLFSATMPPEILRLTAKFQKNPEMITIAQQNVGEAITQKFYRVPQTQKQEALNLLLQAYQPKRALVFCNTKSMVDELVVYLNQEQFMSVGLHGDMKQAQRTQVMQDFKGGRLQILVATDVAARGIDVEDIDGVFNFDIPREIEAYTHRIGRTGRAGKTGAAYTLVCNASQMSKLREIRNHNRAVIQETPLPSVQEVKQGQEQKLRAKVEEALRGHYGHWMPFLKSLTEQGFSAENVACALMSLVEEKNIRKIPQVSSLPPTREGIKVVKPLEHRARKLTEKVSVVIPQDMEASVYVTADVGKDQEMTPNFIVGALADGIGISPKAVGRIQIYKDHTDIELSAKDAQRVLDTMQNRKIKNNRVHFSIAEKRIKKHLSRRITP